MASYSPAISDGETLTFRVYVEEGDLITVKVDDAVSMTFCGITVPAETTTPGASGSSYIPGTASIVSTITGWTEITLKNYSNYGGVGYCTVSGFQKRLIPFEVSPEQQGISRDGGFPTFFYSGSFKKISYIVEGDDGFSRGRISAIGAKENRVITYKFSALMDDGSTQTDTAFVYQGYKTDGGDDDDPEIPAIPPGGVDDDTDTGFTTMQSFKVSPKTQTINNDGGTPAFKFSGDYVLVSQYPKGAIPANDTGAGITHLYTFKALMTDGTFQYDTAKVYQGYETTPEDGEGETGTPDENLNFVDVEKRGYVVFRNENGGLLKTIVKQKL